MTASETLEEEQQYSVRDILGVWVLATAPMALLAWGVMPALANRTSLPPAIPYWLLMTAGMGWLCVLALNIIRREEGNLRWSTLTRRLRLNPPRSSRTGQPRRRLFAWLLPCLLVAFIGIAVQIAMLTMAHSVLCWQLAEYDFRLAEWLWRLWPPYANLLELVSPRHAGQAWLAAGVMVLWLFGSLVAEEVLFRGVLLPKMRRAFGRADWVVNGLLYVAYSAFQPWMLPLRLLDVLVVVWPVRRFRSLPMGLIVRGFGAIGLLAALWIGLFEAPLPPLSASLPLPHLSRHPQPVDYKSWLVFRKPLAELPKFNPAQPWHSVDLRSRDLSHLDLRNSRADLEHANFDGQTTWPSREKLPPDFEPARILELGKNPGLGIRKLHAQGITGRGVGIGIVDQTLLTRHSEYAGQLRWYEEINRWGASQAQMHGAAVSSIAVGKTVGVAPEADLYFIGFSLNGFSARNFAFMSHYYAQGVRRLLAINRQLPRERRIRAISLSFGPSRGLLGFESFRAAIQAAEAEGILVTWCGEARFRAQGLAIPMAADRDDFQSYSVPEWLMRGGMEKALFVPMDSRAVAGPTGVEDYVFYGPGGASWTVPFAAGAFALAAQLNPDLTPEQFWKSATETGRRIRVKHKGRDLEVGPILDLEAVIAALPKKESPIALPTNQ